MDMDESWVCNKTWSHELVSQYFYAKVQSSLHFRGSSAENQTCQQVSYFFSQGQQVVIEKRC